MRQARSAAGRDALLRVVEVDSRSRVPERRAILTPFAEQGDRLSPRPQVYWPQAGEGARRTPPASPLAVDGIEVEAVREQWLVEDRWWTPKPLQRLYFELVLAEGRDVVVFREPAEPATAVAVVRAAGVGRAVYVELHAHSSYSFCDGASLPEEIAVSAAEHGYPAFALTDHDNVCGAMEFAQACTGLGVRPILGAELTVTDAAERFHLTLLVESAAGWHNLCRLLTEAHAGTRPRPDRDPLPPALALDSLLERGEGLVCLSGCAGAGALAGAWERGDRRRAEQLGRRLARAFGPERFRVELQRPLWRRDRARNRWLAELAGRLGVACVATGNVHAHARRRAALQDALVAVRLHTTLEESEPERRGNTSSVLAAPAEMAARFAEHPDAVAETERLAERLRFDLPPSSATATRGPRTPTPTGRWRRSAGGGSSSATPARASARRRRGGSRRSCG